MKLTLTAPNSRGPTEDLAFTLYAIESEESLRKIKQALEHLKQCPWDFDQIREIFDLNDQEYQFVFEEVY